MPFPQLSLYDTRRHQVTTINPRKTGVINLFVCGPTVYDETHIGNARTDIIFDFFVKYLRLQGFQVTYIQNITDIDDKIIQRAKEHNTSVKELSEKYEKAYKEVLAALGINAVSNHPRATDYIPQIIDQISRLMKKGFAYQTPDGVYFEITRFANYGKLAGRTATEAEDGVSRIDESIEKRNKGDFALWKLKREHHEPSWESPWGEGRPGWHIEDTAITESIFGPQYDIHGSGIDLIFPHHEAEVAQMEAISGMEPLVNHWMHIGFLTVDGTKMSKSKGNFITTKNALAKYKKEDLRMAFFLSHYRSPFEYNDTVITQAHETRLRIREFLIRLQIDPLFTINGPTTPTAKIGSNLVWEALASDFNTPLAISHLFNLIRDSYKEGLGGNTVDKETIERLCVDLNKIADIGIRPGDIRQFISEIPVSIHEKAALRQKSRELNDWPLADKLRSEIRTAGYEIRDLESTSKLAYLIIPH